MPETGCVHLPDGVYWSSLEVQQHVPLATLEGAFRNVSADRDILLMQQQQPAPDDDLAASLQALLTPYPADAPSAAAPEQAAPSRSPLVLPLRPGQEEGGMPVLLQGDEPSGQVSAASLGRKLLLEDSAAAAAAKGLHSSVQGAASQQDSAGSGAAGSEAVQWVRTEQHSMVIPAAGSATQQLTFTGALLDACPACMRVDCYVVGHK